MNISQDVLSNLRRAMEARSFASGCRVSESRNADDKQPEFLSESARYPGYRSHGWAGTALLVVGSKRKDVQPAVTLCCGEREAQRRVREVGRLVSGVLPVEIEVVGR